MGSATDTQHLAKFQKTDTTVTMNVDTVIEHDLSTGAVAHTITGTLQIAVPGQAVVEIPDAQFTCDAQLLVPALEAQAACCGANPRSAAFHLEGAEIDLRFAPAAPNADGWSI